MKQGMTFEQVLAHVDEEARSRRDYYVPTPEMHLMTDAAGSRLATPCGQFLVKETAHVHLAELCGIDRRYYQRMRTEAPFLLDRNVNHWLATNAPKQRIVRALESEAGAEARDGEVRAIVSSRYALLDNDALLRTVGPVIEEQGLSVESCDVSEEKLIIKMVSPRLIGDVDVGDAVQAGIIVRNSEVRCSAVEVDWFVKRLVCKNGMVVTGPNGRGAFRRHVGKDWDAARRKSQRSGRSLRNGSSGNGSSGNHSSGNSTSGNGASDLSFGRIPEHMARDEWERGIWEQLQNSLRNSLNADAFTSLLERLALTTRLRARLEPGEMAERIGNTFHLRPGEEEEVRYHLLNDRLFSHTPLTLWGVVNAVTRTAEDVEDYNRATELEELGGHLAHLSPKEWDRLVSLN